MDYEKQTWDLVLDGIKDLKEDMKIMQNDISELKKERIKMYAFLSGVSFAFTFALSFIKDLPIIKKIFNA